MSKKQSFRKRLIIGILATFILLFSSAIGILYWNQDKIVQNLVNRFNEDFRGAIIIGDTDISPFADFPFISVVIENVQVFEDKADMFAPILDVSHIYLGFNFQTLLSGNININLLKVENGNFDIVRYEDGSFNLIKALSGERKIKDIKEEYNIELQKIELANLDIIKYDQSTNIHAETYIEKATSKFKNANNDLMIGLESQLILNVINDGDSTIFKNKHIDAATQLAYNKESGILIVSPSEIKMENGIFDIEGSVNVLDEFDMDLHIHGNNPNFNLLIAFAPEDLIPTLEQYENAGNIYFETFVKGKSLSGNLPSINAEFGCDSAYFINPKSKKILQEISFKGQFTNGIERNLSTMEFTLNNISAKPEAGIFKAELSVKNFETPEIEMSITSNFDLDFLAKFLNVTSLQDLGGSVSLRMDFRDIVDLKRPEKSLERLNQSYFSELNVKNLTFKIPGYPIPFDSIDIKATMDGNHANIEYLFMNIGSSDFTVRGDIDDLPAIVHQSNDTINANLFIFSDRLNIKELTSHDTLHKKSIDEVLESLRLELAFKTTGKDLVQSPNLPKGDFFIKNFYGKPQKYPHTLKKFNARLIIGDTDIEITEFNGRIDQNDISYSGKLYNYTPFLEDTLKGVLDMDFKLKSNLLRLNDLLAYGEENYMPPDYRNEEIHNLVMYGNTQLEFNDSLISTDIYFDQLSADMKIHLMEINDIYGKISLREDMLILKSLSGQIGNTDFYANMNWYLGENDSIRKAANFVSLEADKVDFDQLSNYQVKLPSDSSNTSREDSVFNIYELPFTDIAFDFDIADLTYHLHEIQNLKAGFRIQKNHFVQIDSAKFETAGGTFDIKGYFDGSDHNNIYFYPDINIKGIYMDKMLYRFENFGQDYIVSDNLSGRLSGSVTGEIKVRPDMIPQLDKSEILLKLEIIDGQLKNYKPMNALADYFKDKNLNDIHFDTLSNEIRVEQGVITIPNMTINSTLGFMDISGTQDLDNNMEYYFRVPLKLVTKSAGQKLFGKKGAVTDSTHVDEIQYKNADKKTWYLNLKLTGSGDDFKVSLGRKKKSN